MKPSHFNSNQIFSILYTILKKKETSKNPLPKQVYEEPQCVFNIVLNKNNEMEKLDLNKIELPLSEEKFKKLSKAIETGRIKWRDLSMDLTYAYQAFWRYEKYKNCE